jgi:hypothetical protein
VNHLKKQWLLALTSACLFSAIQIHGKTSITMLPNPLFCSSFPTAYQSGSFSISETQITGNTGFSKGQASKTLILGFSGGSFEFAAGIGTVTASGTEVTINSVNITSSSITVTISTAAANNELNTLTFNNIQVRATAAGTGSILRTGGTFLVDNKLGIPTGSFGNLTANTPIAFSSTTATQPVTMAAFSGTNDNQILGLQVVVTGNCSNLSITQFDLNTTGSTNPTTDITTAKIYYTGTTNSFTTASLWGSRTSPSGSYSITGNTSVTAAGTYYFWLVYDLPASAVAGNVLDAQFVSLVAGGSTRIPSVTNPAGTRSISNNIYYSIATGNWNNTAIWSRSSGGASCTCAPTLGNGLVYVNHAVTVNSAYTVDNVTVQTGGSLVNSAGIVLTVNNALSTAGNGYFTLSNGWGLNNVTLAGTGISGSSVTQTVAGNFTVGSGTTFQMTAVSGTTFTVNGNIAVNGTLSLSGNNMTSSNAAGTMLWGTGTISGTGTITLGVSKTISSGSTLTINPIINIASGVTITNQGAVTTTNNITGNNASTSIWVNDANASLTMSGTTSTLLSTGTLTASATGNTVTYSGSGAQTVKGTTYYNLIVGNAATSVKSLNAALTVSNALTIQNGAQLDVTASNYSISIENQWINNSSHTTPFNGRSGTVTFTGPACKVTGTAVTTFTNLSIGAVGSLLSHPTDGYLSVSGNWINDGNFDHNNSGIVFSGTSTISGASVTSFYNITVASTRALTLHATETDIEGNLTVNGTLNPNGGWMVFTGVNLLTSVISGSLASFTFYGFEINKTGGSVELQKPATITNGLTLTSGLITTTSTNPLTLDNSLAGSGITITGGSATSFINGPLVQAIRSAAAVNSYSRVFPIGNTADYRPVQLSVSTSGAITTNYTAELVNASASAFGYTLPPGVLSVSKVHYWDISQSSTTSFSSATVTLNYGSNDGVTDPANLVIVKTIGAGTAWNDIGGNGSGTPTGTITSTAFTSFSKFTLANKGTNPLPVELLSFSAVLNSGKVNLDWQTASEINNSHFTIERTRDGMSFEKICKVTGAGNSISILNYATTDTNPHKGRSYYRLVQTDFDGSTYYSPLAAIENESADLTLKLFPNPTTYDNLNISIASGETEQIVMIVSDMLGNTLYSELLSPNNTYNISGLYRLAPGVYTVTIMSHTAIRQTNLFIIK